MNHVLPKVEGIDRPIQNLQTLLYNRLSVMWGEFGLTGDMFEMYGRTYRNYKEEGYVPEAYVSNGNYSKDLFFDDTKSALLWFGLNDPDKVSETEHTYSVSLYGFVNLEKLKPGNSTQRMDEAVINDIVRLIGGGVFGFTVTGIYRDIDAVLSKYSGAIKKRALNQDMQPRCGFKIDLSIVLSLDACGQPSYAFPTYQNAMLVPYSIQFKTNPDAAKKQQLINGQFVQLEFPVGNTVTVPYLAGKYINKPQSLNFQNVDLAYAKTTGTFTFGDSPDNGFQDGDQLIVGVNVN